MQKTKASELASTLFLNGYSRLSSSEFGQLGKIINQFGQEIAEEAVKSFIKNSIPKKDLIRYLYGTAKRISLRTNLEQPPNIDDFLNTELKDI